MDVKAVLRIAYSNQKQEFNSRNLLAHPMNMSVFVFSSCSLSCFKEHKVVCQSEVQRREEEAQGFFIDTQSSGKYCLHWLVVSIGSFSSHFFKIQST